MTPGAAERPTTPRTAGEMLSLAREFLARKGCPEARLDAELVVAHALGTDRLGLFLALDRPVDEAERTRARALLVRRGQREPVAYVVGAREFYGRPFAVGPGVLVPRPETELLVDLARERCAGRRGLRVLDVGTGSGCLALTLALELEAPRVLAVDRSEEALAWARRNAAALAPGADVELLVGDGLEVARSRAPFDLVVANPPYVDPAERGALEPEVREHEPAIALFAPEGDPDCWVRRLVEALPELCADGGRLFVELGLGQAERVRALVRERGLEPVLVRDLAGIERVLEVAPGGLGPAQHAAPGARPAT